MRGAILRTLLIKGEGESKNGKPACNELPLFEKIRKMRIDPGSYKTRFGHERKISYWKAGKIRRELNKRAEPSSEPEPLKFNRFIRPQGMSFDEAMVKYGYNPDKIAPRAFIEYLQANFFIVNVYGKSRAGYQLNGSFVEADCSIDPESEVSNSIITSGADIKNSIVRDSIVSNSIIENYSVADRSIIALSKLKNASSERKKIEDCDISNCTLNGTGMINCFFSGRAFDGGYFVKDEPIEKLQIDLHRNQWHYMQLFD